MSTLTYGALVVAFAAEVKPRPRVLAITLGVMLVIAVAMSRILLGAHTLPEVVIGVMVGGIGVALFATSYWRHPRLGAPLWPLLAASAVTAALFYGRELPVEPVLRAMAAIFGDRQAAVCLAV